MHVNISKQGKGSIFQTSNKVHGSASIIQREKLKRQALKCRGQAAYDKQRPGCI
jgi:hypothetical protein